MKYKFGKESKEELKFLWIYTRRNVPSIVVLILLGGISSVLGIVFSLITRRLINAVTGGSQEAVEQLLWIGAGMVASIVISLLLSAYSSVVRAKIGQAIQNRMKQDVFEKWIDTDYMALSAYHSGDLTTRMSSDISSVCAVMTSYVPDLFAICVQLLGAAAVLFTMDVGMCIIALSGGPLLLLSSRLFAGKIKKQQIALQQKESARQGFMQEAFQNLLVIRTFGQSSRYGEKLGDLQKEHYDAAIKRSKTGAGANIFMGAAQWVVYLLGLMWGAFRIYTESITYGDLTAFLQLSGQVSSPITRAGSIYSGFLSAMASAHRLLEILNLPKEIKAQEHSTLEKPLSLCLEEVSFAYGEDKVLEKCSMKITGGEMVALMGPSGEGKSTLIRILLGLLSPKEGRGYVEDEKGGKEPLSANTRKYFSYVPQGNTMFSGTIRENLLCGRENATEEEMMEALFCADGKAFVEKLPLGLDTEIGERGLGLSEGQSQRLAIARALLRNAPVLLFDEATSALDPQTEKSVLSRVKERYKGKTCLVISHRPGIRDYCDKVYFMQNKSLTENLPEDF